MTSGAGDSCRSANNFASNAAKLIRRRIRLESGRTRARLLLALARVRSVQGQSTSAYQSLLDALEHDPDHKLELEIREEIRRVAN